jgi:hypothetical protein
MRAGVAWFADDDGRFGLGVEWHLGLWLRLGRWALRLVRQLWDWLGGGLGS